MQSLNRFIGQTIGIIGGGQLGQMLTLDAKATGMRVIILDPVPHCPAGQVADEQIIAPYNDLDAINELATKADVLTYEFENVDLQALKSVKARVSIPQGTDLLYITKNRIREKTFLEKEAKIKVTPFMPVTNEAELMQAIAKLGYPSVLKTAEGGYDGKGQQILHSEADLVKTKEILATKNCILEHFVDFKIECSVMIARNKVGELSIFPVSENINENKILHLSIVPARISPELAKAAQQLAIQIAEAINLIGVLGVEMFITKDDQIYINELAPRPHNSGHYSIEACNFSQFAVHNRAICNWPMPKIQLLSPVIMINVLGQHVGSVRRLISQKPQWHFHDYGKDENRFNRKMGHITILTQNIERTLAEINSTDAWK